MDSSCFAGSRRALPLAIALLAAGGTAQALEFNATVGTTVEHTNNGLKNGSGAARSGIGGENTDRERSELETRVWANLGLSHQGPDLSTDLGYRLTRTMFKHDTQDDKSTAEGDARLRWQILDQRLFLDASHSRRNVLQDSAEVDLLGNREDRDITTVSPSYILRLGGADSVTFSASWTDVSYDDRNERDSQRTGANISWNHRLSEVDSLVLNVGSTQIDNQSSQVTDYRYDSASVGYSATLSKLSYTVLVGANRADREGGEDDVTGGLLDIEARYRSGFNTWNLTARHGLSDSSMANGNQVFDDFYSYDSSTNKVDVLEETRVMLDWTTSAVCERCTFKVATFYEKEDYEEEPDDNTEIGAELRFNYELTRTASVGMIYRHRDLRFHGADNPRDNYSIDEVRLTYSQRFGQNVRAGIFVGWEERDSKADSIDYDVLSGGFSLSYQFF